MGGVRGDRAALVCVRDSRRFGLQALLRSGAVAAGAEEGGGFLPEGVVGDEDRSASVLERCRGLTGSEAQRRLGHGMSPAHALGFWAAGARVLLAATGVLLAVEGARRVPVRRPPPRERRAPGDAPGLGAFAAPGDLHWDLGRLLFFSRWLDPGSGAAKAFFLVHLPERVRAPGFAWQVPEKALLLWRDRRLPLDFETFACLRTLTDFPSCGSLLSEYASR